jgi:ABC-type ATPase with predicted acetyltransferase domain
MVIAALFAQATRIPFRSALVLDRFGDSVGDKDSNRHLARRTGLIGSTGVLVRRRSEISKNQTKRNRNTKFYPKQSHLQVCDKTGSMARVKPYPILTMGSLL